MNLFKGKAAHLKLGEYGEKLACELIREQGGDVLCCNYRVVSGEIDIVAWDNGVLCFVEVKTRKVSGEKEGYLHRPADAVGFYKRQRLRKAISNYLRECEAKNIKFRADVVEIELYSNHKIRQARWIKSFFDISQEEKYEPGYLFE